MALIRNVLIVGTGTLAARLAGFLRDILLAAVLGAGAVAEAYLAALLLPNLFRRALGEGALNAALLPLLARRRASEGEAGETAFARAALGAAILLAVAIVVTGIVAMPGLILLVAPGFAPGSDRFADAVFFGRIAFLSVGALVLAAFYAALLNARSRFTAPALAALMPNLALVTMLALLLAAGVAGFSAGLALVATVAVAGVLQLWFIARAAGRSGAPVRPALPLGDRDVGRLLVRAGPGIVIAAAGHLNALLGAALSSTIAGGIAWLHYADRLFQLPLGFVAAAVGTVLLPAMAQAFQSGDGVTARRTFHAALEFALLLALPAATALVLLAEPIVDTVFRRAAFTGGDVAAVSAMLKLLALGLPGFALSAVFLPAFLARDRFALPLLALAAGLAANTAVTLALRPVLGAAAVGLGIAAAAWIGALLLGLVLVRERSLLPDVAGLRRLGLIVGVAGLTGLAILALRGLTAGLFDPAQSLMIRAPVLGLVCLAGVGVHAGLALAFRLASFASIRQSLRP